MASRERVDSELAETPDSTSGVTERASDDTSFAQLLREAARIGAPHPSSRVTKQLVPGCKLAAERFELRRAIGAGGMGEVYEAFDFERRSNVALKTLSKPNATNLSALKNEFRSIADISHPSLIRLHEMFESDDLWFFTMDLIVGDHFDRWVRPGGTSDEGRLRAALSQLVGAMHAIHDDGKLHRDLKPTNVLVTAEGRLLVLDFGLAVSLDPTGAALISSLHGVSGTPAYMAPEQATGARVTAASDWYALGVMLFEALTGRLPFEGNPFEILQAKLCRDAPAPRDLNPDAPLDLDALCRALLLRDPFERASVELIERTLGRSRTATVSAFESRRSLRSDPLLLGRAEQLETLRAAYRDTLIGKTAVVFVSGESGIGKSALMEAFLWELHQEGVAVVIKGRCYERESVRYNAFDSLIDDLCRYIEQLEQVEIEALMPDDIFALTRLFRVLEGIEPFRRAQARAIGDPQELRRRAFAAFSSLIERVCDRHPLVAWIDDLQWIDADSIVFLRHLVGNPQPIPALLVVSYRAEAERPDGPLREVREAARYNARVAGHDVRMQPLADDAARALAQRFLEGCASEVADRVAREAQGSPFWLLALCKQAQVGGDLALTLPGVLEDHIRRLSAPARDLLRVVAIACAPVPDLVAIEAANATHDAIDELQSQRLLRRAHSVSPRMLECYHDKIRENAVHDLGPEVTKSVHARLVEVLLAHGYDDPEVLALHCEGAGALERAMGYALAAADSARDKLAFARAADLYERALLHFSGPASERHRLEYERAMALSNAGRGAEAAPIFMRLAADMPPQTGLELRRRAAEQWLVSGRTEEGLSAFADVLAAVGLRVQRYPQTALLDLLATRAQLRLRGLHFSPRAAESIAHDDLARIDVCKTAWSLSFVSTIRAAAFQARHLLYALRSGERYRISIGLSMEAVYVTLDGARGEARALDLLARAEAIAAELGSVHADAFVHLARGQSSYLLGRWQEASDSLSVAEGILTQRCRDVTWELNSVRFFWANALQFMGELKQLNWLLAGWLEDASVRGDLYASATLELIRARLVLAANDAGAARRAVRTAMRRWRAKEFGVQRFLQVITDVQIDLYLGRADWAWRRMHAMKPVFTRSLMSQIQICRIPVLQHAGYAALGMAARNPSIRHWRTRAAACARALRSEHLPMASAFALQIEATLIQHRGDRQVGVSALVEASKALDAVALRLYGAACRQRAGILQGGDEGAVLTTAANELLATQCVTRADDFCRGLAPGVIA